MGNIKKQFLVAVLLAIAIQETIGFVRVGRMLEKKRDASKIDERLNEVMQQPERRSKFMQRRILKQLALAKVLELYLGVAKEKKRTLRNVKDRMPNVY